MRVVYIHMIGVFGGASRSLFEVVRAFPPEEVQSTFLTQRGTVRDFFAQVGPVHEAWGLTKFDNTRFSYYRGVRWLVFLRELAFIPSTIALLYRVRRECARPDILHLNEFTGLPVLWLAKRWLKPRATVVHVRSVARAEIKCWRTRLVNGALRRLADAVIAIDENVRASLPADLPVHVIHNSFAPQLSGVLDARAQEKLSALRVSSFKVGFVGNLLAVKGIVELIEATCILKERAVDVELIIVGDDAAGSSGLFAKLLKFLGLRQSVRSEVEAMIRSYGLTDRVHLIGFTAAISQIYRRMDVLCFPSHYDAPGRPIFEAAWFAVPSIVAVRNPKPDTLVHGVTGLAIQPKSATELADAITQMAADRAATARMGQAAQQLASSQFDVGRNMPRLLNLYKQLLNRAS